MSPVICEAGVALVGCWDVRWWPWKFLGTAGVGRDGGASPGRHSRVVGKPRVFGCEKQ